MVKSSLAPVSLWSVMWVPLHMHNLNGELWLEFWVPTTLWLELMHMHNSDLQVMSCALVLMTLLVLCIQMKMILKTWMTILNCIQDPEYQKKSSLLAYLPSFLNTAWHMLVCLTSLSSLLWHYLFQTQFLTQNICSLINLSIIKTPRVCIDVATIALN